MCMIFHKKFFQWVTAPIPLFQTPQKIGLLKTLISFDKERHLEVSFKLEYNLNIHSTTNYIKGFFSNIGKYTQVFYHGKHPSKMFVQKNIHTQIAICSACCIRELRDEVRTKLKYMGQHMHYASFDYQLQSSSVSVHVSPLTHKLLLL